jgi:EAL domain-containing protein (putative c-di-GMP-specific phosphodiesterase class I)
VLEEACRQAARWQGLDPDGPPISVAVNLSVRQLADPGLLDSVRRAIDTSGIDPGTLHLELTETTLLEDIESVERSLNSLRALGVHLVLDDFGIGFSSLGYLKRLPLSGIKLDRSFVENLADASEDAAIVRAVTEMASALGIAVVAEGVETRDQLLATRALGCGFAQGFYFSEAIPAEEVEALLREPMPTVG